MKKIIVFLIIILVLSAGGFIYYLATPAIPIPDTLETTLTNDYHSYGRYFRYVKSINGSVRKDTSALKALLLQDGFSDGAVYDQGFVFFNVLEKTGDTLFSSVLQNMSLPQVISIDEYMEAGLDLYYQQSIDSLLHNYPRTVSMLVKARDERPPYK